MKRLLLLMTAVLALACSCDKEPQTTEASPAPKLVSSSPENGAKDIASSGLDIVLTYNETIKCPAENQSKITIDNGASITEIAVSGAKLTVHVTGLSKGKTFTLTVPAGAVTGIKKDQKQTAELTISFSTKAASGGAGDPVSGTWEKASEAVVNMGYGWNLGNSLDSKGKWVTDYNSNPQPSDFETCWGQPVTTEPLIEMFADAGFGAMRVPVTWMQHLDKDNNIDEFWMDRVEEVVGWVLNHGMYCILNVHHDTGTCSSSDHSGCLHAWLVADELTFLLEKDKYAKIWTQIAERFQKYGDHLLFEGYNEMLNKNVNGAWSVPAGDPALDVINKYAQLFVDTVRETGGNNTYRNLVVPTYAASPVASVLKGFVLPSDVVEDHLMAEVHSYAPYRFAFEMSDPSQQITVFDKACENELYSIMKDVNTNLVSKGIPTILGEFGSDSGKISEVELSKQAACYVKAAKQYNITTFYWMNLSNGTDRSVPKWSMPDLKDAIINAYNGK